MRRAGMLLLAVGLVMVSWGCRRPLFPEDQVRSPYERYMVLRGEGRPTHLQDPYGVARPNLRQRLRPLDQP